MVERMSWKDKNLTKLHRLVIADKVYNINGIIYSR
jgi:hypothetical protein